MKVLRDKAKLKKMSKEDNPYVALSSEECVAFMWELTSEVWSLKKSPYVKQRLQRNITKLIKR